MRLDRTRFDDPLGHAGFIHSFWLRDSLRGCAEPGVVSPHKRDGMPLLPGQSSVCMLSSHNRGIGIRE